MTSHRHGSGRIFWGLVLIIIGSLFLLDRMGELDFGHIIGHFWPVVFILIGFSILINSGFRDVGSGMFFILFGAIFLLFELGVLDHHFWHYVWPLAIIVLGLWIILKPVLRGSAGRDFPQIKEDDLDATAVFTSLKRRIESKAFKGGEATAVFGSMDLDFTPAALAEAQATVELTAVFGGIDIRVPKDWKIVLSSSPILGGIHDRRSAPRESGEAATLYLKATAVFGGIEIKD
ncbi:MAG: cell wall-active antibiotics response protein [Candidatus Aminicenantes bacterium]|nr:cell wall-active antibiotics response protein [Candidatus Aminicenantes bacterium]